MDIEILKIGEVIEVRGQKVRAKVYKDKNESNLNYCGEVIKNVSVGGFVKIRKGFQDIIGKIEGEFTLLNPNKQVIYYDKEEQIHRVIEISLIGYMDRQDRFHRGLSELPLISNYVYILSEEEIQSVFAFSANNASTITIGEIIGYNKYKLKIGVQSLFASHIGIFGNTGSGKSNTLAKIYKELFDIYKESEVFKNSSKFLIIDFNGEYENTISNVNKKVYHLSTRRGEELFPIDKKAIEDLEFWSIILEATEKTQQPFLKKCIQKFSASVQNNSILNEIREMINSIYDYADKFSTLKKYYKEILSLGFDNCSAEVDNLFGKLAYHSTSRKLYIIDQANIYFNSEDDFKHNQYVINLLQVITQDNLKYKDEEENIDEWDRFEFIVKLQYANDVARGYINEEHIAPLLRRLDNRLLEIRKIFKLDNADVIDENLQIISLVEVNIEMRKIIPMIVCKRAYDFHKLQENQSSSLFIIVDEAHNILSKQSDRESSMWKDYRLELFEEIIKEGRKFGVFLTISSQRPSDISETIISQLHNYFLHRLVNNEDIKAIGRSVSFLDGASFEMIPILPQGGCIMTGTACNFPVLIKVDKLEEKYQPQSHTINLEALWSVSEGEN
ncbi:ATP-binding protein [Cellulosilyticum lentocellum]|uniref:Helicase HerA central domain-containing protein n=1 Tax=Cellulosilyticum lentocellum (strain ATCC 49066 / DSM 5427 / NCIMB 11756 / RHM5) TaxID=642492 RepID=F2JIF3_CELLD|nr:ATP-binding protein [Cellulosilyticum lentocellum]ADZ84319.1 protein of unknown function DUF87 [Cellulosilyticum lentocellum DSM 5427]